MKYTHTHTHIHKILLKDTEINGSSVPLVRKEEEH